jgi:hypothetical protein
LEQRFAAGDLKERLINITNAKFIERQLPVGLFKGRVARGNEIFTRGKSAIDLWGVNKENDLLIFELKAGNNARVGIISELFFYVCVMQELKNGRFKYEGSGSSSILEIAKTRKIIAYLLAPKLHCLITPKTLWELNNVSGAEVEYKGIAIGAGDSLKVMETWYAT